MSASVCIERLEDRIPASETLGLGVSAAISGILSQDRGSAASVAAETSPALSEDATNGTAKAASTSKVRKSLATALLDAHFAELSAAGTSASVGSQSQFTLTAVRDRGASPVGGALASDFASLLGGSLTTGLGTEPNGSAPETKAPGARHNSIPNLPAPIATPAGGVGGSNSNGSGGSAGFTFSAADNGTGNASTTAKTGTSSGAFFGTISASPVAAAEESIPTVTVRAAYDTASEASLLPGGFVITRVGSTAGDLVVKFTVNGTATNGTDYDSIPTSVTIPAELDSVSIDIWPVQDTDIEGSETVELTLSVDAAYTIGAADNTATLHIRDRAAVDHVKVIGGMRDLPQGGMDFLGGTVVQGDVLQFEAVPTEGGDFAPNEPVWTDFWVGQQAPITSPGHIFTVGFTMFHALGEQISVTTPGQPGVSFGVDIIPRPTDVTGASMTTPVVNYLPGSYGTDLQRIVTPDSYATGGDLNAAIPGQILLQQVPIIRVCSNDTGFLHPARAWCRVLTVSDRGSACSSRTRSRAIRA